MPLHLLCQGSGRTKAGERNWGNPAFVPDRQPDHAGPSCDRNHWIPLEAGRPATVFRLYRGPVSQPQQACDPDTVGVGNDDAWSMVDVTQDQIGGFPANTRQG